MYIQVYTLTIVACYKLEVSKKKIKIKTKQMLTRQGRKIL